MPLTMHYHLTGSGVTVQLQGELGHHEAIRLMGRLGELLEVHLPRRMVLDLSGLEFMDSSGIAVIVQTNRRCLAVGAALTVENTPPQAMKVLSAAGIQRLISIR